MTVRRAVSNEGLEIVDLSFAYTASSEPVLRHLDWSVSEGEFVVVAGESGSGKSTLLRCLNGLVPHFSGGRFGGMVVVRGDDTRLAGPRGLSSHVGFVFQDPDAQRVSKIVEDELAFGMEQFGVPRLTMRKRIEEVLDLLGIAELRGREMETLSGGERQRVAVAAALTVQPKILVLDEPTSQLDPWGAEDVISALERLNQDLGLTVVMSEHRLERVLSVADRMSVIRSATELIDGGPADVLRQMDAEMLPPVTRLGRALEWVPAPLTIKQGRAAIRLMGVEPLFEPARRCAPSGRPVISVRHLHSSHGRRDVLRAISFDVRPGEVVALMGRNGSGKSTLLRSLMGFHKPDRGRIEIAGADITGADPADIAKSTGYLPQRPGMILFNETVRKELEFTLRSRKETGRDLDQLLEELGLSELAHRNPRDLSTGEQERTALAAILVADPPILLLDEPTRGMDYRRKKTLSEFIQRRCAEGIATILATHDVELVAETATRVILLGAGEIVADGAPREVLSGSLSYATQMNKLLGGGFLTVDDALEGLQSAALINAVN